MSLALLCVASSAQRVTVDVTALMFQAGLSRSNAPSDWRLTNFGCKRYGKQTKREGCRCCFGGKTDLHGQRLFLRMTLLQAFFHLAASLFP